MPESWRHFLFRLGPGKSSKLFQETVLESLKSRHWLRKLHLFYTIFQEKSPLYLYQLIPPNNKIYVTKSSQRNKIPIFNKIRYNFFKDFFLPVVITEWSNLDINIQNPFSTKVFQKELLKLIKTEPNFIYYIHDTKGLKLLARLQLGFR